MDASRDNPPPYAFVTRVYRSSLRPVVVPIALITGIWTLVWYIGLFKEIKTDDDNHEKKLATFAIALGALYLAAALIEFFGVAAGATQRFALIRIYSFLSVVAAVLVIGAGLVRVIVHFMLKGELISECTTLASNKKVDFTWGIWGPHLDKALSPDQASTWCNNAWSHDSWSEIISLIVEILLMAFLTLLAFSYAHQSQQDFVAPQRLPAAYAPPYAAAGPTYAAPQVHYEPPAGPPPGFLDEDGKPPGYGGGEGHADRKGADIDDGDPFSDFEERR
ncbi:hypothetical protein BV25DRAFT_1826922 [Artomyces pyxidatus]|uniref:Uncharacterized protein n=1 Tax=Artomyces pyxidatus TaxID=48021 RepID=A0ACB8SZ04_9AGAM|nr:hypothetical protein BV25DRAFT_1826922 [Artomyces pyxidatus]